MLVATCRDGKQVLSDKDARKCDSAAALASAAVEVIMEGPNLNPNLNPKVTMEEALT